MCCLIQNGTFSCLLKGFYPILLPLNAHWHPEWLGMTVIRVFMGKASAACPCEYRSIVSKGSMYKEKTLLYFYR